MTTPGPSYPHLFAPIAIGTLGLPNRIVMGSMHTRLECEPDGARKLGAFYAERARGGTALVITGGVAPNRVGAMEADADVLDSPDRVPFHRVVTEAVHEAGGLIAMQILHAGRYARVDEPVGASDVPSPINRRAIHALTEPELERTIEDFARCAALARAAGYDGVEIMGSEGYLITQFTCPRTNTRTDRWGGSRENRFRLPLEIVRRVREAVGKDFPLIFRISAIDLVEGGLDANETVALAGELEAAGVDALDTGIGWHESRVPTIAYVVPRASWAFAAKRLKAAVRIPVMATNRINTPEVAEALIAEGLCDLVSLGRPMLADAGFANKAKAGARDSINVCIACNQACLDFLFRDRPVSCLVNPRAGRETEFVPGRAALAKRVAVVGAGAAGLSCAVTAAERGHRVTLYEAKGEIGGQLNLAKVVPGKEFTETIRHFACRLAEAGVDLRLHCRPDAESLLRDHDEVVVATGVTPRVPEIEGIDHPMVLRYDELLAGERTAGRRVAIIGAGGIGYDSAAFLSAPRDAMDATHFLAAWGVDVTGRSEGGLAQPEPERSPREITLFQRKATAPGRTLGLTTGWALKAELARRGVKTVAGVTYVRIDDEGLHYLHEGAPRVLPCDTIVLCAGQLSERSLFDRLVALGGRPHLIGGAERAEELDALRAFDQGMRVAYAL